MKIDAQPLQSTDEVTPQWLSTTLTRAGYLFGGSIKEVTVEPVAGQWSSNARLLLSYEEAHTPGPASLFLKMAGGQDSTFEDAELRYYSVIGRSKPHSPLPHCYHAGYSDKSKRYHLLLEDLSSTHSVTWERSWQESDIEALAIAFASLHAPWWNAAELSRDVAPLPNDAILARYFAPAMAGLEPLLKSVEGRVSHGDTAIIRRVFTQHPALMRRRAKSRPAFTCIHGDPNPGNILFPNLMPGRCYLIDRQPFDWSLQTWLGVNDLAYLMVHWWPTETRRDLEGPLLLRYHVELETLGVTNYSWADLWLDYRLTAMQSFYVVGEWCSEPEQMAKMEWVWWPQLLKTLQAFKDLRCDELLNS